MADTKYKYDVAFSFMAQDEPLATQLNDLLQDRLKTFLYSKRQGEIAGKDGEGAFGKVFGEEARIAVVLYRKGWGKTPWTRIEEIAIRNRAFEHGYDFVVFIPLDDPPSVPKWLPKTQLWVGFKRWGITGAASVIEARVQELGGSPREETINERAARLQRSLEFAERRRQFLESTAGVQASGQEFNKLHSELARLIEEVKQTAPAILLEIKRSHWQVVILGFGLGLNIVWHHRFSNTLDNAELRIELWDRHPPFLGLIHFETPNKLDTITFKFDLLPSGEYRWTTIKDGARSLSTKDLASYVLKYFMDKVQRA